jgi:hypothetical protein
MYQGKLIDDPKNVRQENDNIKEYEKEYFKTITPDCLWNPVLLFPECTDSKLCTEHQHT